MTHVIPTASLRDFVADQSSIFKHHFRLRRVHARQYNTSSLNSSIPQTEEFSFVEFWNNLSF